MRVWLAGFVVLFVGVELFEWFAQLGSVQASGMGLILGGMGLAAASNAGRWQKPISGKGESNKQPDLKAATPEIKPIEIKSPKINLPEIKSPEPAVVDRSQDSISFKVRWPWR